MDGSEYSRYSVLAEVAELYFLKGMQQAEIAVRMKISRSLVSRMISEAQEKGIVSITINHFFKRSEKLENDLCSRYGLEYAGVLILPKNLEVSDIKKQLGRFTADQIHRQLKPGAVAGFTFGTTLKEVVEALALKQAVKITCLQLTGSLGAAESAFDSQELVNKLSSAWNCDSVYLHAPLLVNSEEIKGHLFNSRSNILNLETCAKLDTAVIGLSSFDRRGASALVTGGHLSAEDMRIMQKAKIIGDAGSYSLDKDGNLVEVDSLTRMIGLREKEWKKVKNRYGVAFGEQKLDIIKAALKGGWLTGFFTDEQTAERIL
jgi:DNA-binding transcriptional regulator LsrR (DeoR family)